MYESHRSLTAPNVNDKFIMMPSPENNNSSVIGDEALLKIVRSKGLLSRDFVESIRGRQANSLGSKD